jgi:hypothetical protein
MRRTAVRFLSVAALLATAACDGDGSGSSRLSPDEVAAVYRVCSLRFVPEQSVFPAADLLQRVIDTTPPAGKLEPTVTLSSNGRYQLSYTEEGTSFSRDLQGEVGYRSQSVRLSFYSGDRNAVAAALLLPERVDLNFQGSPRRLTTSSSNQLYAVARREYAQAAGISESGLATQIFGTLEGSFREGSCN